MAGILDFIPNPLANHADAALREFAGLVTGKQADAKRFGETWRMTEFVSPATREPVLLFQFKDATGKFQTRAMIDSSGNVKISGLVTTSFDFVAAGLNPGAQ